MGGGEGIGGGAPWWLIWGKWGRGVGGHFHTGWSGVDIVVIVVVAVVVVIDIILKLTRIL